MTRGTPRWMALACALGVLRAAIPAGAQTSPGQPAAVLVYPYVAVDLDRGVDTLIQLTNVADEPTNLRCFYEGVVAECVNGEPDQSCDPERSTCTGQCVGEVRRHAFGVRLTARQPVAWRASEGLRDFPLGPARPGPGGETNGDSEVPGIGRGPTTTTLRCVVVGDDPSRPAARDVLAGLATVSRRGGGIENPYADAAQYRAIGVQAMADAVDEDEILHLGGSQAEYRSCPANLLLEHYFTFAPLRTGDRTADIATTLVLVPCTTPSSGVVAQFLVFNEFSQRFSTSRTVPPGELVIPLAMIDTRQPERSIFSIGVAGTLGGSTQIRGVGGGLHALAIESHRDPETDLVHSDAVEVHGSGQRAAGDAIVYRGPECVGDCDADGVVAIDEVITSVGIGSGAMPVERCRAGDRDGNGDIAIDEMVSSVGSSIHGCPSVEPAPTPTSGDDPTPAPTTTPASLGPEITHLGLAGANDRPLEPETTDGAGRPVYTRPFGQGFTLVIEARRGADGRNITRTTFAEDGSAPGLQVLVSQALGDGDPTVCEQDGVAGGVPAHPALDFAGGPEAIAAMNDLGCRAFDRSPAPDNACTRVAEPEGRRGPFDLVGAESQLQFCIPLARAWAMPAGDTIVAARVGDDLGNFGEVREIVVRVGGQP